MFEKLKQLIEQQQRIQSIDPGAELQLTMARDRKKDFTYRLFYRFINHIKALNDYRKTTIMEYDSFLEALKKETDKEIRTDRFYTSKGEIVEGLSFEFISTLAPKIMNDPENTALWIIKYMLSDRYQPPKDISLLWRHLYVLLVYYSLPLSSNPILTNEKIDLAARKLAYAVGISAE